MAKRKLLNKEREIILFKSLQHTFKDVVHKLDVEYKVINNDFINWYKSFISLLTNLDYSKCEDLANKNLIKKFLDTETNKDLLIKDEYYTSFKNDNARIDFYGNIRSILSSIQVTPNNSFYLSFARYAQYVGNYSELAQQKYAQAITVYIVLPSYLPSFGSDRFTAISSILRAGNFTDEFKAEYESILAEYAVLNQKLNQVINDLTAAYHTLKAQLKAITTAEALEELLPIAYSFLPPIEEREPTQRQLASKALISYGTIAHLNGLLTKGYQL